MYIVVGMIMGEVVVYLFFQTCFAVIGLSKCTLGDARVEYRPKNENVGYIFVFVVDGVMRSVLPLKLAYGKELWIFASKIFEI